MPEAYGAMNAEPGRLRLFPLNTVLFPGAVLNLHVFEPRYKQLVSECLEEGAPFGVSLIREGDEAGDPAVSPYEVGTTAEIGDLCTRSAQFGMNFYWEYGQVELNGHSYTIQPEYSNQFHGCAYGPVNPPQ